jgi:hypothetical protein
MFKMLKNPILKVKLSRIFFNISTYTKCSILQNGLHVDEILIFKKIQRNGALKTIYVLSNYECCNHNIYQKINYESRLQPIQLYSSLVQ